MKEIGREEIRLDNFGNRLRKLRESEGLTQKQVAADIQCSCKVLSNYELGKREPDFDTLVKLSDYFNVTTDYLLGRTKEPHQYNDMTLNETTKEILSLMKSLPHDYHTDILRYTKMNILEFEYTRKKNHP